MSRRSEIYKDFYQILCKVYRIYEDRKPTDNQDQLLNELLNYIEENLSTRKKRKEKEEAHAEVN